MGMPEQYMGGGALYALPFRADFWVVFYNKDLFDAAGVDYPTNEMTFDDWVEVIKAVTHGSGQDKVFGNQFHWWRSTVTLFGILDGVTNVGDPDYGWMKHYYEAVIGLEDGGYVPSRIDNVAGNIHHRMRWFPGEIAQVNMGSWFIAEAVEQDFNWGIASYPVPSAQYFGNTFGGVTQLSIPRSANHPQEAFDFIAFVCGAEGAAILASVGQFPAYITDEALSIITSMPGFPEDAQSKAALQPRNIFLEQPVVAEAGEIDAILSEAHAEIMDRTKSIDDGIKMMEERVSQLLGS
jgi:multiple sugar transport system substrate-binding protein